MTKLLKSSASMNALSENIAPRSGYFASFQLKQECPDTEIDVNYKTHASLLLPHFPNKCF